MACLRMIFVLPSTLTLYSSRRVTNVGGTSCLHIQDAVSPSLESEVYKKRLGPTYQITRRRNQKRSSCPKILESPRNSTLQNGDMQRVPNPGPTNIRRHRTTFCRPGNLEPGFCAPPNQNTPLKLLLQW
jgi:hypothetical protein